METHCPVSKIDKATYFGGSCLKYFGEKKIVLGICWQWDILINHSAGWTIHIMLHVQNAKKKQENNIKSASFWRASTCSKGKIICVFAHFCTIMAETVCDVMVVLVQGCMPWILITNCSCGTSVHSSSLVWRLLDFLKVSIVCFRRSCHSVSLFCVLFAMLVASNKLWQPGCVLMCWNSTNKIKAVCEIQCLCLPKLCCQCCYTRRNVFHATICKWYKLCERSCGSLILLKHNYTCAKYEFTAPNQISTNNL